MLRERGDLFEQDGAQWVRTSKYGDEKDRVVVKSDGNYTYLAPDVAYHLDKARRGFDLPGEHLGRRSSWICGSLARGVSGARISGRYD